MRDESVRHASSFAKATEDRDASEESATQAGGIRNPTPTLKIAVHKSDEQGNVYTLLEPIEYMGLSIPVGFESDGASVPRFFWRVVFPPGDARALYAAFVHDFLYRTHPEGWIKKFADVIFEHLLICGGIAKWRAKLAYWGVKWFGGEAWKEGRRDEIGEMR